MKLEDWLPFVGWGVAGVPVVATFLQAVFALAGVEARMLPLVGGLIESIISMQVFKEAAIQFKSSTGVVLLLFVLIALAWVAQGFAMGTYRNRDVTFACAGLVSVLFLVLFFGVYAPLLSADVGSLGLALFVATPFVASLGALGGAWLRNWEEDLEAETATKLSNADDGIEEKRERFDRYVDQRLGSETLDRLTDYAPGQTEEAWEAIAEERAVYEELEEEVEAIRSSTVDSAVRRQRAIELSERVKRQDPEAAVERIESSLAESVIDVVDRGDISISVRSRYGQTYELVNLPSTFRELSMPPDGRPTHVDDIDRAVRSLTKEENATLDAINEALSAVDVHRDRIERHISDAEERFHEMLSAAEEDVDLTREELERLDGEVYERVEGLLIAGHDDAFDSVYAVEADLRAGREALHACRFDEAQKRVAAARETADALLTTVQFFGSIAGAFEHGQERLSLPGDVSTAIAEEVAPAFEREHGVEYAVSDGVIVVLGRHEAASSTAVETRSQRDRSRSDVGGGSRKSDVDVEQVVDELLVLLNELRDVAEPESVTVHLGTDDLPSYVATEDALAALETFTSRHSDVVETVEVPDDTPGIVDLKFADDANGPTALETLRKRLKDEYV